MKTYIKEIVALTIGLICSIVVYNTQDPITTPIVISMDYQTQRQTDGVQIFYTDDSTQTYSFERYAVSEPVCGIQKVEFKLYIKELQHLRIDFGKNPGNTFIRNLKISGDREVVVNYDDITTNELSAYGYNDGIMGISSDGDDPFIAFNKPFNIKSKESVINRLIYANICLQLGACFVYLIILALGRIKGNENNKSLKFVFLCLSCALACYLASKVEIGEPTEKPIELSIDVQAETKAEIRAYYTSADGEPFNDEKSVATIVNPGSNKIKFELPIHNLYLLRLDFGSIPKTLKLDNIKIHGNSDFLINDFSFATKNDINKFETRETEITINSEGLDPWIAFLKPFNVKAATLIIPDSVIFSSLFLTLFALLFFISTLFCDKISGKRTEDIALTTIFLGTCIIPSFYLSDKTFSEKEKRNLEPFPTLIDSTSFNNNYTNQFDKWYSDHFPYRDELVTISNSILQSKDDAQNDDVMEGRDGFFFLKNDHVIENFANIPVMSDEDLIKAKDYLCLIDKWCKAKGKKFLLVICPNKATIYPEKVKHIKKINNDANSDAMRFLQIMNGTEVNTHFMKDEFLKHKNEKYLLYRKQDTHYTDIAAYYTYETIMNTMGKDLELECIPKEKILSFEFRDNGGGDLKGLMPGGMPQDTTTYIAYNTDGPNITFSNNDNHSILTNSNGSKRLYILGDSFTHRLEVFLALNFQFIETNRKDQYFLSDETLANIENNADALLFVIVERHLSLLSKQTLYSKLQAFALEQGIK